MKNSEELFDKYLEYEQIISKISTVLLNNMPHAVNIGLEYIIQLSKACRIYIFQNFLDENNDLCMRQIHEICAEGITPEIDNPELQKISYQNDGFGRWKIFLEENETIIGDVENFPQGEKDILAPQGILSILVIPISLQNHWFGFIGFDYTRAKKAWSKRDILLLKTASELFAAYFESEKKSKVLKETLDTLHITNKLIKQQHEETQELNKQLTLQKQEIQKMHGNVMASINYAQRIQEAIIPSKDLFNQSLGEENYFILFKPKDIVSGDFYFLSVKIDVLILAVIDCTGHGVPGAFMTMIGHNILSHIVNDYGIYEPNEILNLMPILLKKSLRDSEDIKDGMDLNIITLYKTDNQYDKMKFAGAMNPLYYIQNQEFNEIKGDKIPIGGLWKKGENNSTKSKDIEYQSHEILVHNPTYVYLITDGYADQFGGTKNKKFKSKNLKKLLFENHQKSMSEQQEILDETLENWKKVGNEKQIDDITILAFKLT